MLVGNKSPYNLHPRTSPSHFRVQLHRLLEEEDIRIQFAVIEALMKEGWPALEKATILTKKDKENHGQSVISVFIKKLTTAMDANDDPTRHAACRITCELAKLYIKHFYNEKSESLRRIHLIIKFPGKWNYRE
jgi:hypothetical protein